MTTTDAFPTFRTVDDVRHRHTGHWFDGDTLRFFGSRIGETLYAGRFFTSSEHTGFERAGRAYTVRVVLPDASIDDAGGFLAYTSSAAANRAAERLGAACRAGRVAVQWDPYPDRDGNPPDREPRRRHYEWRAVVTLANGETVPIGTRNTWREAHRVKRWLLAAGT